jgi:hypothetical protein
MPLTNEEIDAIKRPGPLAIDAVERRPEPRIDVFVRAHADRIAVALCVFSALRILFFAAAFPLTNNTDERFHLMTIQMYAQGQIPGKELPRTNPEFAKTLLLYWSPEYGRSPDYLESNRVIGPLYKLPSRTQNSALSKDFYVKQLNQWLARPNYEAQSAPFYYVIAAGWYRLGSALGMSDWGLNYWLRFLNVLAYGLLVGLSYKFCRNVYPENYFLCIAVPALIAVFPQDVFFGINRDVFSAPLSAAVFLLLIKASDNKPDHARFLLFGSLLTGLAFVTSVSNCVLFGSLASALWLWAQRSPEIVHRKIQRVCTSVLSAGFLPALWMLRNYLVMGDLTGGKAKAHELTWTVKPLGEMLPHPLFSRYGLGYFVVNLTRSFWQGEYTWHGIPMRSVAADRFYILSSTALVLLFAVTFVARWRTISSLQRLAGFQALFLVAASVLFLAAISLPFDFHECAYPSRLYPFFVSGRIISGALLPFILIYASGLEMVTNLFRRWIPPVIVLACLMLFITVSEIRVRSVVFSSPYNFFALSGSQQ